MIKGDKQKKIYNKMLTEEMQYLPCFLTVDVNIITVDDVIGRVDSLAAVPAAVFPGHDRDLVARAVDVRGDGVHWIVIVPAVPLEGDRRSAFHATDEAEMIPFCDFCHGWDDDHDWVGERHCGEERDQ